MVSAGRSFSRVLGANSGLAERSILIEKQNVNLLGCLTHVASRGLLLCVKRFRGL